MNALRKILALAALAAAVVVPPAAAAPAGTTDQCMACHEEEAQARAYRSDIHFQRGITCAGCHGGDATSDDQETAMSRARGYRGKVGPKDVVALCAQCHGDSGAPIRARYKMPDVVRDFTASVHGEALHGNDKGPQCVSCHGVHNIQAVDNPASPVHPSHVVKTCSGCHSDARYMRDFNPRLPVDQYEKYVTSVHGQRNAQGDPKPATCVSCHSNHMVLRVKDPRSPVYATRIPGTCAKCHADAKYMAQYRIPTDQYEKYRHSQHGIALLEKSDLNAPACNSCHGNHAATPPGAAAVVNLCSNCHQSNAELFNNSLHKAAFEKKNLAGCVGCHGNHLIRSPSDSLVTLAAGSPCAPCHRDDATDPRAGEIRHLRAVLDSLTLGQKEAEAVLGRAEQLGMDVSDARYGLKDVHQALVQSRVAIHSFKVADIAAVAAPGIKVVAEAKATGAEAIREYHFRRQGLVVSTLIVTFVALLLWLKIREIDRRKA